MKKWIWLGVVSLVLLGFFSMLEMGSRHFGKSYVETEEFSHNYNLFTDQLIALVLDPITKDKEWPITAEDIEEYRNRYGNLADQIRSIQDQYIIDIEQAQSSNNESLEKVLIEERDKKLGAITANFADDDVVREKIKEERAAGLTQAINQISSSKSSFLEESAYYVYRLKDIETGETFTKGTIKENPFFEQTYTAGDPLSSSYTSYYTLDMAVPEDVLYSNAKFEGTVQIDKDLLAASMYAEEIQRFEFAKNMLFIFAAMAIAGIILLFTTLKYEKKWFVSVFLYHKWKKLMIEIRFLLILFTLIFALGASADLFSIIQYTWSDSSMVQNSIWMFVHFSTALLLIGLAVLQLIWFTAYYKNERSLKVELQQSIALQSFFTAQQAFLNKSIGFQALMLLIVIFFWGFGTALMFFVGGTILIWIPATLFIGLPVLFFMLNRFGYLNVLMQGTENIANGRLNEELPIRGKSALAHHARQLNLLKEGVRQSMSEQAKSERLKTELITNVSHDLRTPLTSIITYTDLMKAPDLSDEERLSYVAILDRKSQRLKTLIEDLFEVSKMASGNMELQRTRLDLTQLMTQALAEHAEDIEASGLDFRINAPDKAICIHADGQKWWRVLDNLIINAIKYALPGTRVYISLTEADGQAEFVIKNVTRYELGENTDELFERFKRGDVSRQTEGSGLGLAIAQSIVELHGGSMKIEVDGDLFKVTVAIRNIRRGDSIQ
ncbi:histidine kinase dimerization/phospho-acceptor domain-containing protein [Planomicrobium sp. CPCC 101110]|uniref:sensor histidine kinase n=1 Tax=Planomicrobium sp. CPCC 101110 TaxID=2599619 RepID=UPI0016488CDC|nr:histidine kinase dimerization/phospho-acceptor domain-containing protein [Planomicrobium sp. CPCC 101110]